MSNTIGERLSIYIKEKNVSKKVFSEKIGLHYNYVVKMLKGSSNISSDTLTAVLVAYPNLNARWLTTGVGTMEYVEEEMRVIKVDDLADYIVKVLDDEAVQAKIKAVFNLKK
ncbi:helix-turn-helix transcriptional regulator [Myroides odoratimimus]|uniref:HTH cro/C1-type domain-containing protein n=1 Tax=Myroides odoratimimus TaxID=76832 RepID=A0AAI8C3E9_9FLAO|nr:helix-turn-helix transcriptional regulator [Myroides odoratimimus]ALU25237.1 hypothetical protein AS202_03285 [Myroides odoratimimus]MDM1441881.1 helix-turn-helix transcriptional regulator [Myroides odoratimimus]